MADKETKKRATLKKKAHRHVPFASDGASKVNRNVFPDLQNPTLSSALKGPKEVSVLPGNRTSLELPVDPMSTAVAGTKDLKLGSKFNDGYSSDWTTLTSTTEYVPVGHVPWLSPPPGGPIIIRNPPLNRPSYPVYHTSNPLLTKDDPLFIRSFLLASPSMEKIVLGICIMAVCIGCFFWVIPSASPNTTNYPHRTYPVRPIVPTRPSYYSPSPVYEAQKVKLQIHKSTGDVRYVVKPKK